MLVSLTWNDTAYAAVLPARSVLELARMAPPLVPSKSAGPRGDDVGVGLCVGVLVGVGEGVGERVCDAEGEPLRLRVPEALGDCVPLGVTEPVWVMLRVTDTLDI